MAKGSHGQLGRSETEGGRPGRTGRGEMVTIEPCYLC